MTERSVETDWTEDAWPDDMSDALNNVAWAVDQMIGALDAGRYNFAAVHVRADLTYLRGEIRRAKRQRSQVGSEADRG